jgi:hypothetical protein
MIKKKALIGLMIIALLLGLFREPCHSRPRLRGIHPVGNPPVFADTPSHCASGTRVHIIYRPDYDAGTIKKAVPGGTAFLVSLKEYYPIRVKYLS